MSPKTEANYLRIVRSHSRNGFFGGASAVHLITCANGRSAAIIYNYSEI
jgi:hypothetical protein